MKQDDSLIIAVLPASAEKPTLELLEHRLASAGLAAELARAGEEGARLRLDNGMVLDLAIRPSRDPGAKHMEYSHLAKDEIDAARASAWSVGLRCALVGAPLESLHRQLKVLNALAPDAVVMLDANACSPKSGDWLRDAASSSVPPGAASFFTIHSVFDKGHDRIWLHTHGLGRFGIVELEILDLTRDEARALHHLINTTAAMMIEYGVPPAEKTFPIGQEIDLVWVPWQKALTLVKVDLGGLGDRDKVHGGTSGVLFAPSEHGLEVPRRYAQALRDNPLLYVSRAESERLSRLANERLSQFVALHARFAGDPKWMFLAKLGYPMDGARSPTDREHLWFRVHAFDGDEVEATLLNQPYGVSGLNEGDRGRHKLALLTDWAVLCPRGLAGPSRGAPLH